ncbi:hypothetical protein EPO15_10580 [bacterium]|nr:MAG: hypothetical protein EPO15_10580 [bacterium]
MTRLLKDRLRDFLALIGIQVAEGNRWDWRLTPRFFTLTGGAFVFFIVANVGMVHYSESPSFCNSCHIMAPYYEAWRHSKHNKVACVECHYAPVENVSEFKQLLYKKYQNLSQVAKYVTRTYNSKPFAEVEDASCLRSGCHSTRLLEGKVDIKGGLARFDHRPHLSDKRRGRQLRCTSCHSQMVMGKHIEVTYDTCVLCHFKDRGEGRDLKPIAGCVGCHDVPKKAIKIGNMTYDHREFVSKRGLSCLNCHMDVVSGKGDAPQDRCFTCHNDTKKLEKYSDIPFVHEQHVTKKGVACFHCHTEMRHGLGAQDTSNRMARLHEPVPVSGVSTDTAPVQAAAAPHGPSVKFDCALCHTGQHDGPLAMYSGKASHLGAGDMPSPMFLADVDCVGCHYDGGRKGSEIKGHTVRASAEACVKCHGQPFAGVWQESKTELGEVVAKITSKEAALEAAVPGLDAPKAKAAKAALASVTQRLDFVRAGRGEHNIYLASKLLTDADSRLTAALAAAGVPAQDLSALPLISGQYCATMCHTKAGVKVPPETVRHNGKKMPHGMHVENASGACRTCHDIGGHKKVPLKKGVEQEVCSGCHPK